MITPRQAAAAIRRGQIVAFPTESFWALGVDATNPDAIRMLFKKKLRMRNKPVALIAADMKQVLEFMRLNPLERKLAATYWPGPFTLVVQPKKRKPRIETSALGARAVGIRVPAHTTARRLAALARVPITATSANVSAEPPTKSARVVAREFPGILIVRGRCGRLRKPSTVVAVEKTHLRVIRSGAIPFF